MKESLPIIDSCNDCGACCREQDSPPGYVMLLSSPNLLDDESLQNEDVERFRNLPAAALAELRAYMHELLTGNLESDQPCIWLDLNSMQCRYYEHRPSICRNLEVGGQECREWRDAFEIDT